MQSENHEHQRTELWKPRLNAAWILVALPWALAVFGAPFAWKHALGVSPETMSGVGIQVLLIQTAGLCLVGLHLRFYRSSRPIGAAAAHTAPLAMGGSLAATVFFLGLAAWLLSVDARPVLAAAATLWWLVTILAVDWWIRRASAQRGLAPLVFSLLVQSLIALAIAGSLLYGPDDVVPMRLYPIVTESMEPTIHGDPRDGDWVLVDTWAYRERSPRRLDVVLFTSPLDPEVRYIKRVIGLPGETVALSDTGRVRIDNGVLELPAPLCYFAPAAGPYRLGESVSVPPGHYVVLGDADAASTEEHRLFSFDCRRWTMIEYELGDGRRLYLDPETPIMRTGRHRRFRDIDGVPRQVEHSDILSTHRRPVPTLERRHLSGQVVAVCWPPRRVRSLRSPD